MFSSSFTGHIFCSNGLLHCQHPKQWSALFTQKKDFQRSSSEFKKSSACSNCAFFIYVLGLLVFVIFFACVMIWKRSASHHCSDDTKATKIWFALYYAGCCSLIHEKKLVKIRRTTDRALCFDCFQPPPDEFLTFTFLFHFQPAYEFPDIFIRNL